jgi:hypothetical protein
MEHRKNLLWLGVGILTGSFGLGLIATILTGGTKAGYAQAHGPKNPSSLRLVAYNLSQVIEQVKKAQSASHAGE